MTDIAQQHTIEPNQVIAPCGMDCRLCVAFQRAKKPCAGCMGADIDKPKHCVQCTIKTCPEHNEIVRFCYACGKFPCRRLKQLDARYRLKYGMSMLENLQLIREVGEETFFNENASRWTCPSCGRLLCAHISGCSHCQSDPKA